ncbi:hypothetical protein [Psychrobacter frigidicola]|uniref:hypothetical protein n=1 Tax=Psychrobacter frigidicola TaxID=45611 RepID=UPI001919BE21|nr:hypothetical protein [Psychrobacter frigidicola]
MAQYLFVKNRKSIESSEMLQKLEQVCSLLTPTTIKGKSQNTVEVWPEDSSSFYAIQNSESVAKPEQGALIIGWMQQLDSKKADICDSEADGSYAVVKNTKHGVSFFSDQFGSRTLWYYCDESTLIISTSQRAIVALKGGFNFNEEALAWYLSSGNQGPFISWDQDVKQVLPHLEYKLNIIDWRLGSKQKPGIDLPPSGSTKMNDYPKLYQSEVTTSLDQIISSYPEGQVLMPLSGGLDSRLLLALSKKADLDDKLTLVNWGVVNREEVFDDKVAAQRVADFYGKDLLDMSLPAQIDSYDQVLDSFVEASEGRIDHFNAFTDSFKMWDKFFQSGYRMIIRGDIPFTEGLDINTFQARAHIGLEPFKDYANISEFPVRKYIKLQNEYEVKRLDGESLIRWRDRLYASWRVPMVISAFSNQISGFTENRSPMLSWSLFKLYMGLPDKDKGNKTHIKKLWEKNDKSGVSCYAVGSLNDLNSLFENKRGNQYLIDELAAYEKDSRFSSELIMSIRDKLAEREYNSTVSKSKQILSKAKPALVAAYSQLNDNIPLLLKSYIRSKRVKNLSATTLAYRIVLAEKIITMYESDAKQLKVSD